MKYYNKQVKTQRQKVSLSKFLGKYSQADNYTSTLGICSQH